MRRSFPVLSLLSLLLGACQPPPPAAPIDATSAASPPGATDDATAKEPASADDNAVAAGEPASKSGGDEDGDVSQADLPPAESVLAKAVDAVGGHDRVESIKSYVSVSTTSVPQQGFSADTKLWWKEGALFSEMEMPGVGMTRMWVRDDGVWAEDPVNGKRELEGTEARQARWSNSLVLADDWQKYFGAAKTVRRRKSGGRTLIDVRLVSDDGDELTLSFDEKDGLLREERFTQDSPQGEIPVVVVVESYLDQDGFKSAAKSEMTMMKLIKATTEVKKLDLGAKVPASKVAKPAWAKGKAKAKGAEKGKAKGAKSEAPSAKAKAKPAKEKPAKAAKADEGKPAAKKPAAKKK